MKKIEILNTSIFADFQIISGVTKRNLQIDKFGFSISQASIYNESEINNMKKLLAEDLNYNSDSLIFQKQIHSDIVNKVDSEIKGLEGDAFISKTKGIILNVSIADCAAILLYDPNNEAIGAIHSGWKGTKENIVSKTIELMSSEFGTESKNLFCYISPCAGADVYEVENDVAQYFPQSTQHISDNKYLFDNRKEILLQLLAEGVIEKNIELNNICTIKDNNYHSYRRDKNLSGRMSAFIGMTKLQS